jgi:hypothetical protein
MQQEDKRVRHNVLLELMWLFGSQICTCHSRERQSGVKVKGEMTAIRVDEGRKLHNHKYGLMSRYVACSFELTSALGKPQALHMKCHWCCR